MAADNPDIQWALDLLTDKGDTEPNFFAKHFPYLVCGAFGPATVAVANYAQGRPPRAGLQRYVIGTVLGLAAGHLFATIKFKRESTRDALLRFYIKTHPEDFPEPEKRTFNDIFHPWSPWR